MNESENGLWFLRPPGFRRKKFPVERSIGPRRTPPQKRYPRNVSGTPLKLSHNSQNGPYERVLLLPQAHQPGGDQPPPERREHVPHVLYYSNFETPPDGASSPDARAGAGAKAAASVRVLFSSARGTARATDHATSIASANGSSGIDPSDSGAAHQGESLQGQDRFIGASPADAATRATAAATPIGSPHRLSVCRVDDEKGPSESHGTHHRRASGDEPSHSDGSREVFEPHEGVPRRLKDASHDR